ncbi:MAG: YabP/YqfC family sporulation protein [Lachnospiraceae bacterium]
MKANNNNNCKKSNIKKDLAYIKAEINNTEKKWRKHSFNRTMRISEYFNIPCEVFQNNCIITVIGHNEIMIENYGRISDYSDTCVAFICCECTIQISGECLKITCYTEDEVIIKGIIKNISFGS